MTHLLSEISFQMMCRPTVRRSSVDFSFPSSPLPLDNPRVSARITPIAGAFRLSAQRQSSPASRTNCEPVTKRARLEARKTTASATSSGSTHGTGSRLPADRSAT